MGTGILLVDKHGGITSHDVVSRVRRLAGTRKVGHAGTLDPMATGLVIVGINSSTRLLTYLVGQDKEYVATIRLGQATTTDDAEGEITTSAPPERIAVVTADAIALHISPLTGAIEQVPSTVSAIKVNGKRAYALARAGEEVVLKSRPVTVSAFDILAIRPSEAWVDVDVRIECSSGTYIRALARDLGVALDIGGHLTALRRTRIGPFSIADAHTLDDLDVDRDLISPAQTASEIMQTLVLDAQQAVDLGHGKRVAVSDVAAQDPPITDDSGRGPFAALAPDGRLIGLVEKRGEQFRSLVNLPQEDDVQGEDNTGD